MGRNLGHNITLSIECGWKLLENMDKFKNNKKSTIILTTLAASLFLGGAGFFGLFQEKNNQKLNAAEVKEQQFTVMPDGLRQAVERAFVSANEWPESIEYNKKKFKIEYAFNDQLDGYIKKLLKTYRSDYSTVTVVDNETGEVLAAVGHEGKSNNFDTNLVLSSTHPSASLIKIVTAAGLLQHSQVKKETPFEFRGRSTTLFKYQLNESRNNRWDKTQTFETAFAKSNNVIFGKAAISNLSGEKLVDVAESFGFNQPLFQELPFIKSHISRAEDEYQLAELASGFNDQTSISPVHAAVMASIIANNGVMKYPKMISRITEMSSGEVIWENTSIQKKVLSAEAAHELQEMMGMTIDGGTARKSFRKMNTGYKNALEIGGKTGSITGGKPFGKRDWFAAYAIPREGERGKGISISVMNVNVKRWHVKSTMLAKSIIEYYYNNVRPVPITMIKMPRYVTDSGRRYKSKRYRAVASRPDRKKSIESGKNYSGKKKTSIKKIGKRNERKSSTTI